MSKTRKNTKARQAAKTVLGPTDGPEPLYGYSYEISRELVDSMATALAGDRNRNPAGLATAVVLVAVILLSASPISNDALPLLVVLVVITMGLWTLNTRWRDVQLHRLRRMGFDLALIPEDKRRREVRVFDDHIEVAGADGTTATLPLSGLRRVRDANEAIVLAFSDGFVPVPRRALSQTRFEELRHFAYGKAAK